MSSTFYSWPINKKVSANLNDQIKRTLEDFTRNSKYMVQKANNHILKKQTFALFPEERKVKII